MSVMQGILVILGGTIAAMLVIFILGGGIRGLLNGDFSRANIQGDLFSFLRPEDTVNEKVIRERLRKDRRPLGKGPRREGAGGPTGNREHDFARAAAAAAGYIEKSEDMSPDLEYAVRKQLRMLARGDRMLEEELWTVFRTCGRDWRKMCAFGRDPALIERLFTILTEIASSDYVVSADERQSFIEVAAWFGYSAQDAEGILNRNAGSGSSKRAGGHTSGGAGMSYDEALRLLGVSSLTNDREVRKAYLRLAQRCHPDKARNRGFSEETIRIYQQKFEAVTDAWNVIRAERGI